MTGQAILTAAETRAAERALFDAGMPEYDLMVKAGTTAADIILPLVKGRAVLVLCGPGNNGGDGYVIAQCLKDAGVDVRVAALTESATASSRTARAAWTGPVEAFHGTAPAAILVDALFGTGLSRGLDPAVSAQLAALADAAELSVAIDLPSGLDTDTGTCLSPVPQFDLCIALGVLKPSHMLHPGCGTFTELVCANIGLDTSKAGAHALARPVIATPKASDHKYTRGYVAVVGGAMAGAGALAAIAAARGGAGYVLVLAGAAISELPHAIVQRDAAEITDLREALADARLSALLVGPGLGRDAMARARLDMALDAARPLVVDGDALSIMTTADFERLPKHAILTPHAGEFMRLFGTLEGSKLDRARAAARTSGAVVVYKGADTVIAAPDGRIAVSNAGSPWLSTAGTGDVLAGLCVARLATGPGDAFDAACAAVWLHSEASNRAGVAFIADDLLAQIAPALARALA